MSQIRYVNYYERYLKNEIHYTSIKKSIVKISLLNIFPLNSHKNVDLVTLVVQLGKEEKREEIYRSSNNELTTTLPSNGSAGLNTNVATSNHNSVCQVGVVGTLLSTDVSIHHDSSINGHRLSTLPSFFTSASTSSTTNNPTTKQRDTENLMFHSVGHLNDSIYTSNGGGGGGGGGSVLRATRSRGSSSFASALINDSLFENGEKLNNSNKEVCVLGKESLFHLLVFILIFLSSLLFLYRII